MEPVASKKQVLMMRLSVVLVVGFILIGTIWYGLSETVQVRILQNIADRAGGPLSFRFILQPVMAAIAALRDGLTDAKTGRSPYLWTILTDPAKRGGGLKEGLISTARIILLGLIMDTIYQIFVLGTFFPGEAAIVALMLAFGPYLLLRGPIARVARWRGDSQAGKSP